MELGYLIQAVVRRGGDRHLRTRGQDDGESQRLHKMELMGEKIESIDFILKDCVNRSYALQSVEELNGR